VADSKQFLFLRELHIQASRVLLEGSAAGASSEHRAWQAGAARAKEFTPARRGVFPADQAVSLHYIKGVFSMSFRYFSKWRLGGKSLGLLALSAVLIKPAIPAAASR